MRNLPSDNWAEHRENNALYVGREVAPGMIWRICRVEPIQHQIPSESGKAMRAYAANETRANMRLLTHTPQLLRYGIATQHEIKELRNGAPVSANTEALIATGDDLINATLGFLSQ